MNNYENCEYYYKTADAPEGSEDCHCPPDADLKPCENDNDDFKKQIASMSGMAITMLEEFMKDCRKMAIENWCPSQVGMLDRLFKAVCTGQKYDEVEI